MKVTIPSAWLISLLALTALHPLPAQQGPKPSGFPTAPQFEVKSPLLDVIKPGETKEESSTPAKQAPAPSAAEKKEVPAKAVETKEKSEGVPVMAKAPAAGAPAEASAQAPSAEKMELLPEPNSQPVALPIPAAGSLDELANVPAAAPFVMTKTTTLVSSLAGITLYKDSRVTIDDKAPPPPSFLSSGIQLLGLDTPAPDVLKDTLSSRYLGKKLTFAVLEKMVEDIIKHFADNGRPTTHVYIPEQELSSDKVCIAVLEGRIGQISMKADEEAKRSWYDHEKLRSELAVESGSILDKRLIEDSIYNLNLSPWSRLGREDAHPFRTASVELAPSDSVLATTDLSFKVTDRMPVQVFAGYDNTGTVLLGEHRFNLGAVWFDAFSLGWNHQMAVQFQSDVEYERFHSALFSYQIPIKKWNQYFQFFAAYMDSSVEIPAAGVEQVLEGTTWILGVRHHFGLPTWKISKDESILKNDRLALYHEVGIGFDFKASDNNLAFGGTNVFAGENEVAQFMAEYNARQTDRLGETTFNLQFVYSPGGLTANNDDEAFLAARSEGTANYIYSRATLGRVFELGKMTDVLNDFKFHLRATGQVSNENLIASEQLGLGGFDSVRGYPERVARGDYGLYLQAELYSPAFHPLNRLAGRFPSEKSRDINDELRFLVFFDYGYGDVVTATPAEPGDLTLASVGFGLRYRFNKAMTLRFDYGFQLEELDPAQVGIIDPVFGLGDNGYAHLGLSISF
ncbi:ShlB/FhaC/HecB family hemolysin secretion/activation protein [Prosthecobacter sp. SYSU 5D2]|uniref:ShlB/FhaC/HecB family hemolysin secretion/activation protein n=1 Tax=Prosthecobacter sp. SYSU 5D2 TaxID=3134134 RepID=UPI0031FE4EC5